MKTKHVVWWFAFVMVASAAGTQAAIEVKLAQRAARRRRQAAGEFI